LFSHDEGIWDILPLLIGRTTGGRSDSDTG